MTRADRKVQPVIEALEERGMDAPTFPVVGHMFGPREAEAREIAARIPGVHYMAPGATLRETCGRIIELPRAATETEAGQ
jgi:hypothetical protein